MNDADRDRLAALLAAQPYRDRAMRPDELQGLCVAMAMGPDPLDTPDWLEVALATSDAEVPDGELVVLLERLRVETAEALHARTLLIDARETRTGRIDYTGWCRGFLVGVEISGTDWSSIADPEDLDDLMFPIDVLGGALSEQERASYKPAEYRALLRDCEAALADSIARLADYWAIVRSPPQTVRREEPKVGRNDACPCGSGRKFKHCHGKG